MWSTGSVDQPIELLSELTYLSKYPFNLSLVAMLELTLHHPPPFTLATALHRLQPAQGRVSTTPTSWRARHCNVLSKGRIPMQSTALGRILLTRTLQWRARQDVGVVDALPCASWSGWRRR